MINNNKANDNFLNDYINYRFMKEKQKFNKLTLSISKYNNSKKNSKIDSYNTIESKHINKFPYLNYKSPLDYKSRNKIPKNFLSCIKRKPNNSNNKLLPKEFNINTFNEFSEKDKNNNSFANSQREHISTKTINSNKNDINKKRIKKVLSLDKIEYKINNRKLKNLKIELDKELIVDDKTKPKAKDIKNLKKIRREKRAKKEKEEGKIIDTLYIGKSIINHCKIKNKIIYDIRPLNKTKERASCHFDSDNDNIAKPLIKEIKNDSISNNANLLEPNTQVFKNYKNLMNKVYSTNSNFHNNILKLNINEERKNSNKTQINKNKIIKYEFSEQELINKLKISDNNKNNSNKKYITINNIKKEISYPKFLGNSKKVGSSKNILEYIDLSILGRDLDNSKNKKNLKSFFVSDEENVIRGEKIKFLKTCYEVKLVKPILSQHIYEFKAKLGTKKIFSPKRIEHPVHYFNLDILKDKNIKSINDTQNHLLELKKNINIYLSNLSNHLDKEIKYFQ